jgi:hypothetical protein
MGRHLNNFYFATPQFDVIDQDNFNFYYGPVNTNVNFNFPKLYPTGSGYISWKITKLTFENLWFEVDDKGDHYEMKLER